ncbi:hypothetical protein [Polyangium sorediatum]|uniref:Uncharacterized protein n=1 Tax=Polyangium sorediatum TaxID=889274 RepID=A0ABT6P7S4_9BACT|nr:hypothetical protein [Polyangium sorediatum]MDI1436220.1 hypothetical protein [Polyangium sorediatum]
MAQRFTMNITNTGFENFTGRDGLTNNVYRDDSIEFQLASGRTLSAPVTWPANLFASGADPFDVTTAGGVVVTVSSRAELGAHLISTTDVTGPGQGTKTGTINVGSGRVER